MNKKQKKMLIRILVSAAMLLALHFIPVTGLLRLALYLACYAVIGYDIVIKAVKNILRGHVFDENFLMAVATAGAFALGILNKSGDYDEAVAVMLFYQIGELFQSIAVGRSRKSITELMDIRPDHANVEENGSLVEVDPDEVSVGSIIVIKPGEKVPIDGIVTEGESSLDTAALTGESVPRTVREGEEVLSGCINMTGVLKVKTSKEAGESTASKILELVENASSNKSQSENFISKFARVYTPIVCFAALSLAVLPPVVLLLAGREPLWTDWLYRALTFLVISCPCALVVSIPLTFFAGLGGASREGILVKGSNYLETLSKTKTVVFDKTGTLTEGVFEVSGIHHSPYEDEKLLEYAAHAELLSSHPIAKSILRAYGKEPDRTLVTGITEDSGRGVTANVGGHAVAVGNELLMAQIPVEPIPCHHSGTIIHIAVDGSYAGHIVIDDRIKAHSKEALKKLYDAGVRRTVMLTGDGEKAAAAVAEALGVSEFRARLLPDEKVAEVERLLSEKGANESLAFAGDGINDAPVLSRADIGIAMGALGSDAAIEAADVVLMDDDPLKIPKAVRISKKCLRIVYENIVFAIGVKLICLILSALGLANMGLAVFADVGVMVLAVLNAIRSLRVKNL